MHTFKLGAAALPFCFVMVAPLASAEDSGQMRSASAIEEVVVTARRREETIQEVPIPVTALTGDQMRARGVNDILDISRLTPNLQFDFSGTNKTTAQVFLRGIGQVNWGPTQDPKVGIYMDGVYLGRPQGSVFDLLDVERLEVLRGPQGTLFGRNTTAGLVHIINNKPEQEFDAFVRAGAGNDDQWEFQGMVNIPLTDTLAARFAAQHRQSDGYVENVSSGQDWNDENRQNLRASLRWEPSDAFSADVMLDYQRVREHSALGSCEWTGPDNGADTIALGGLPFIAYIFGVYDEIKDTCNATRPYRSTENDADKSEVDAYGVTANLVWDVGIGELTSISSYRTMDQLNQSWGWASDAVGTASYLEVITDDDGDYDQWSQELRLAGQGFDDRLDWVVGAYAFEENARQPGGVPLFRGVGIPTPAQSPIFYAPFPVPGIPTFGVLALITQSASRLQVLDANNSSWAVFTEGTYRITEKLALTAGVRYTEDDRNFRRSQTNFDGSLQPALACPDGQPPRSGKTCEMTEPFDETTPRAILSYALTDDVMVYAGWSKGYSSGGMNGDVRMRPYKAEVSKNWEAGVKSSWLDRRVIFNLTGFYNDYSQQQVTVGRLVNGQPTADLINAQKAELYGVEGEFTVVPLEGLVVTGSFGIMDGEYDEFTVFDNLQGPPPDFAEIIVERDLSDTEAVRGPPFTYSISTAYTHFLSGGSNVTGQVGWFYRGRSYNTLETARSSRQGKYGLLDGRLTWALTNGKTLVSLWGTNLLDREYYNGAVDLSIPPSATSTITKYWGEPRRFGIEVSHSLGAR